MTATSATTVHLLVLIHGMWGHPGHLAELQHAAAEKYSQPIDGTRLEILTPETNREDSTYDGIDWGGERVAKEILEKVSELENSGQTVSKISITGYSLGGLIARYVVGILHQQGFFNKVAPITFNTIATPNIGLLRYPSWISSIFSNLGPKLLSRTGEQFYCVDQWSPNGRPLLVVMADPERVFYQGLSKFKTIRIYANAVNDMTVPYVTSAIEIEDPFVEHETNGISIDLDPEYKNIIQSYSFPEGVLQATKPCPLTRDWFRERKNRKTTRKIKPMNVAMYALLPLLLPAVASLVIVRLGLAACSSRTRIKALEATEASEKSTLLQALAHLEQEIEGAVVDTIVPAIEEGPAPVVSRNWPIIRDKDHPILTPDQYKIAGWLNTLPLKKQIAFFPEAMNAHGIIIARDIKRFPNLQKDGLNSIRHWVDSLEV